MGHESFVQQLKLFWFHLAYKNSHANVLVNFVCVCVCVHARTGYQIWMVIWLSEEDAAANICTVLSALF